MAFSSRTFEPDSRGEQEGDVEETPRAFVGAVQRERPEVRTFVSVERVLLGRLRRDEEEEEEEEDLKEAQRAEGSWKTVHSTPPTPLGLPGGWTWRNGRGEGKERAEEEGDDEALLLPPPFLADDSARESFEGLLGSRAHRHLARLQAQHERLHSLGRAPPPPFPQNLVKAALKVVRLLGPPSGFSLPDGHGGSSTSRTRETDVLERAFERGDEDEAEERRERKEGEARWRRGVQRAESGVRAFEVGTKVGRKLAGRLERHRSFRGGVEGGALQGRQERGTVTDQGDGRGASQSSAGEAVEVLQRTRRMRAATPSDLLGSPPQHAFSASPSSSVPPHEIYIPSSPTLTPMDALHPLALPTPLEPVFRPFGHLDAYDGGGENATPGLPTVQTPFTLDPTDDLDEGYFGLRRRGSKKKRRKDSVAGETSSSPSSSSPSNSTFTRPRVPSTSPKMTIRWYHRLVDLLIYFLIGSPLRPQPANTLTYEALDTSYASLGGLLGLLIHLIGFAFFLLYHTSALLVSSYFALKTASVWAYWAGRNLTGRTKVSRSVTEYWRTCRREWDRVCEEQGERTLGAVGVARALAELAALQSMTRHRFLSSGPGSLRLLNGPSSPSSPFASSSPRLSPMTPQFGPSLSRRRNSAFRLDRPAITQRASSYRWKSGGDEQDGEGLVVERQGGGVLEGSLISQDWKEEHVGGKSSDGKARRPPRVVTPKVTPLSLGQVVDEAEGDDPPPLDLGGGRLSPCSPPLHPLPEHPSTPLLSLLTTLKRHCRLATASYGLHVYLVDAPTPLHTPSGKTLPQRVFAHLGGMSDHRNVLHVALQDRYDEDNDPSAVQKLTGEAEGRTKEEKEAMPYAPTFYLLRDDANGEIVCVIRGTQSLADVRTDLDGNFVDLPLPAPHPPSSTRSTPSLSPTYRIHSSILSTARNLLTPSPDLASSSNPTLSSSSNLRSPLFDKLGTILHDHPRYSLTFTGHSLGAALASTLAILLGAYDEETKEWYVDPRSELAERAQREEGGKEEDGYRRPLRAVCFAHPTTVCASLAARCALPHIVSSPSAESKADNREEEEEKGPPLVLNVSMGADVICRMGIPHVRELRRAIGRLDRMRNGQEGVGILSGWWKWRKAAGRLAEAEDGSDGTLALEKEELEERAWRLRREVERWDAPEVVEGDAGETAIPAGKCYHLDRLPSDLEARRRAENEEEGDTADDDEPLYGLWEVKDPRRFYRMPQLEGDLVAAHMPKAYLDAVDALILWMGWDLHRKQRRKGTNIP
ncbi:hypothetical protein JCM11251_001419 [Rhodosporidiobolus azoricus]